jgi:hypothetical protein
MIFFEGICLHIVMNSNDTYGVAGSPVPSLLLLYCCIVFIIIFSLLLLNTTDVGTASRTTIKIKMMKPTKQTKIRRVNYLIHNPYSYTIYSLRSNVILNHQFKIERRRRRSTRKKNRDWYAGGDRYYLSTVRADFFLPSL